MWILKGTCYFSGHDWKDGHKVGQVVFVYSKDLPKPYAPGQYPRVGNTGWCASDEHFEFGRVSIWQVARLLPTIINDIRNGLRGRYSRLSI